MKLTLEPTGEVITVASRSGAQVQARVWRGEDEQGVPVLAYITLVSPQTHDPDAARRFAEALRGVEVSRERGAIDFRYFID